MSSITNKNISKLWIRMKSYINARLESIDASVDMAIDNAIANAGHMEMELLWENASPTSTFTAQEIPADVDPDEYDGVIVVVRLDVSGTTQVGIYFDSGDNGLLYTAGWFGDRAGVAYRSFTYEKNTAKRYTVSGGTYFNDLVNTTSNSYCIPLRIYGIKGVK